MINFDEFESADRGTWATEAERLLRGKPLSILDWRSEQGLELTAYYDKNDLPQGETGPLGNLVSTSGVRLIELLNLDEETNKRSQKALNMGAEGVLIESALELSDYSTISSIWPEHCWFGMTSNVAGLSEIVSFFKSRNAENESFKGFIGTPWLIRSDSQGEFKIDLELLHQSMSAFSSYNYIRTVDVPLHLFQEQGASITTELAIMLGILQTVIENSRDQNIAIDALSQKVHISTAVGTDFYHEIAKIRALRKLAFKLFRAYDIGCSVADFSVVGRTSKSTDSSLDSDTNYLRKTTEALSIVLGTADGLIITPFETNGYSEDARRIARNIGNLIKEESYGHWVQDPLAGSYFVESLTEKLCEAGWEKFQKIEAEGGFLEYISDGRLSADIDQDQNRIWKEVNSRHRTLVGVNDYPNRIEEARLDSLRPGFRHSKNFEVLRYQLHQSVKSRKLERIPTVQPITVGENVAMITARLNFATNFLGCGGFQILKEVKSSQELSAAAIVICGADDDYARIDESQVAQWRKNAQLVILAGNPKNADSLQDMGIDVLIHLKSDVLATNTHILKMLKAI